MNQSVVADQCLQIAYRKRTRVREALIEDVIDESTLVIASSVNEVHSEIHKDELTPFHVGFLIDVAGYERHGTFRGDLEEAASVSLHREAVHIGLQSLADLWD